MGNGYDQESNELLHEVNSNINILLCQQPPSAFQSTLTLACFVLTLPLACFAFTHNNASTFITESGADYFSKVFDELDKLELKSNEIPSTRKLSQFKMLFPRPC